MTFEEILDHAIAMLQRRGRLTYGTLKRQFELDDAALEDLKDELISLEGERKQVTVLFADLKGSTELIRDLDPEAAQKLLDPALHAMMDSVHRFEGTVNQVLGDGIMALFGAPISYEDYCLPSCCFGLAM